MAALSNILGIFESSRGMGEIPYCRVNGNIPPCTVACVFFSSLELATPCGSFDSFLDVQLQASVKRSGASLSEMERHQSFFSSFFKTNL